MFNQNIKAPVNIPVSKIHPFEGNPYKVLDNDEMNTLIGSIQEQGILTPIIIRPIENTDEYEVISGHRRLHATVKAGIKEVPAFIYAVTRDEAAIMLVDSNLHREHILPSERAFAYKLKAEALKHQGKRSDLTSVQVAPKLATEQIGVTESISKDTVKRYIRLTYLIPELLELVDEKRIAFTPAVELSYLNEVEQADLVEEISICDATPNLSQAQRLRAISRDEGLTPEHIGEILAEEKANQREKIKIPAERIRKYFPKSYTTEQIEEAIIKICESRYRARQGRDAR